MKTLADEVTAALPFDDDPSVEALDAESRAAIGDQWEARATAELRVASMFATIARELFETGAARHLHRT